MYFYTHRRSLICVAIARLGTIIDVHLKLLLFFNYYKQIGILTFNFFYLVHLKMTKSEGSSQEPTSKVSHINPPINVSIYKFDDSVTCLVIL